MMMICPHNIVLDETQIWLSKHLQQELPYHTCRQGCSEMSNQLLSVCMSVNITINHWQPMDKGLCKHLA